MVVTITVSVEPELLALLDAAAKAERRSRSRMVAIMLEEALAVRSDELPAARAAVAEHAA